MRPIKRAMHTTLGALWTHSAICLMSMCSSKKYAVQEEESLEVLPESATSCMAEAEAFLLVAEYTIREARSRVLYSQAWPGQQSKTA